MSLMMLSWVAWIVLFYVASLSRLIPGAVAVGSLRFFLAGLGEMLPDCYVRLVVF